MTACESPVGWSDAPGLTVHLCSERRRSRGAMKSGKQERFDLSRRAALVLGGCSGIGRAIAVGLADPRGEYLASGVNRQLCCCSNAGSGERPV